MEIPSGKAGISQTLDVMRDLVRAGKKSLTVRQLALSLVKGLPQKDYAGEVKRLFYFVRDHIRYVRDIVGVETVHTPDEVLANGQGDCDDKSILLAALLESIGHPTRFVAVGFKPGQLSHVLVETKIGNRWVSLETTEPVAPGWQPKKVVERMERHV